MVFPVLGHRIGIRLVAIGIVGIVRGCRRLVCFPDDGIVFLFVFPGPCDILHLPLTNFLSSFHLATVYLPTLLSYLSAPSIYLFYDEKISLF